MSFSSTRNLNLISNSLYLLCSSGMFIPDSCVMALYLLLTVHLLFLFILLIFSMFLFYSYLLRFSFSKMFKGTLMQIWKSANMFVFIWKWCVEDFTLKYLLLFQICARVLCENFAYKYSETIEYVRSWPTF